MKDAHKTKKQWIEEAESLRCEITRLEKKEVERQGIEKSLRESEERFKTLYQYNPIALTTWQKRGDDFVLIDYNHADAELTEGREAFFVGKTSCEILRDRPDILNDLYRCFNEKTVVKRETPYLMLATGADKYIAFTSAFIPPDMILVHYEDITRRKTAEDNLRMTAEELRALFSKLIFVGERERKRIANDLHDAIGQYLTAIKFNMEDAMNKLMENQIDHGVKSMRVGIPLIQKLIKEVRRIIMDLRPTILDDLGILATISWFCRKFRGIYLTVRVETDISLEEHQVPEPLKITIFRLIQESMNNAVKHSKADLIRIRLGLVGQRIELSIIDNGKGFNVKHTSSKGLGLISMRERTEGSGGTITVESSKGMGTIICASWPQ